MRYSMLARFTRQTDAIIVTFRCNSSRTLLTCQGSSNQWPLLLIRLHAVTLEGHNVGQGKLMLKTMK